MRTKTLSVQSRRTALDEEAALRHRCRQCRELLVLVAEARDRLEAALLSLRQPELSPADCKLLAREAAHSLRQMAEAFEEQPGFSFLLPYQAVNTLLLDLDIHPSGLSCIADALSELFGLEVSATRWLVRRRCARLNDRLRRLYARTNECRDLLLEHRAQWRARRMELRSVGHEERN